MDRNKRLIDTTVGELMDYLELRIKDVMRHDSEEKHDSTTEFIGIKEAAKYVHLSIPTLYRLVMNKEIPFSKTKRKLLFKKEQLREWIENRNGLNLKLNIIRKHGKK
jgi:excisionase family DNA binding protein